MHLDSITHACVCCAQEQQEDIDDIDDIDGAQPEDIDAQLAQSDHGPTANHMGDGDHASDAHDQKRAKHTHGGGQTDIRAFFAGRQ